MKLWSRLFGEPETTVDTIIGGWRIQSGPETRRQLQQLAEHRRFRRDGVLCRLSNRSPETNRIVVFRITPTQDPADYSPITLLVKFSCGRCSSSMELTLKSEFGNSEALEILKCPSCSSWTVAVDGIRDYPEYVSGRALAGARIETLLALEPDKGRTKERWKATVEVLPTD